MPISKAWNWSREDCPIWLSPSEESHYLAERWQEKGFRKVLDLGSGLGRHSVFFAKKGFQVSAFDLSEEGVGYLKEWAGREGLDIDVQVADMLSMPYPDAAFDCVFAFHAISHTDTLGIRVILSEMKRVLKPGGEFFLTLCSKETWSFQSAGYPVVDENTVVKNGGGPEDGIPHFYVNLEDVTRLLSGFELIRVRHTDDCWFEGKAQNSKHYFILGAKP